MTWSHEGLTLLTAGDVLAAVFKLLASVTVYSACWWPIAIAPFLATWHVLERARRPGWTSLVPVYSWIQLLRVAGLPAWWLLVLCVPGVNVVAWFVACSRMAQAFGRGRRFALGLALLPPVFMIALALGDARYRRTRRGVLRPVPLLAPAPEC